MEGPLQRRTRARSGGGSASLSWTLSRGRGRGGEGPTPQTRPGIPPPSNNVSAGLTVRRGDGGDHKRVASADADAWDGRGGVLPLRAVVKRQ